MHWTIRFCFKASKKFENFLYPLTRKAPELFAKRFGISKFTKTV